MIYFLIYMYAGHSYWIFIIKCKWVVKTSIVTDIRKFLLLSERCKYENASWYSIITTKYMGKWKNKYNRKMNSHQSLRNEG